MNHNIYKKGGDIDAFNFDNKMALINLNMIYEYAIKLDKLVSEDTELEEWVKMKLTRIEQNISDVKHSLEGWEKYNQGGMIFKKQLLTISNYSKSLIDMIQGGSQLMSWQESKLAICANDIDGIYHHLDYKMGNRASETFELGGNIGKGSEIVFFDKYYDKKRTGTIISEVGKNEYEVGTAIGTKLVSKDEIIGLAEKVEDDSWFSNGGEIENLQFIYLGKDKINRSTDKFDIELGGSYDDIIRFSFFKKDKNGELKEYIGHIYHNEDYIFRHNKEYSQVHIVWDNYEDGEVDDDYIAEKYFEYINETENFFTPNYKYPKPSLDDYDDFYDDGDRDENYPEYYDGYEMGGLVDKKEIEIQEYDKDTFIEFRVPSKIYNEIDAYVKVFFEYEEIEVSYLQYDEFIDVKEDAYIAYDYEVEFLTDSPTEITDEMKQQLNEEAKKVYDSYFHKYSYDGLFDIFANYAKYRKPENKYEAGGGVSDKYIEFTEENFSEFFKQYPMDEAWDGVEDIEVYVDGQWRKVYYLDLDIISTSDGKEGMYVNSNYYGHWAYPYELKQNESKTDLVKNKNGSFIFVDEEESEKAYPHRVTKIRVPDNRSVIDTKGEWSYRDYYKAGGRMKKVGEYKEGMWDFLEFHNLFIAHLKDLHRQKNRKPEHFTQPRSSVITSSYDEYLLKPHKYEHLKKYQTGNWRDLKFTKSELEQLGIKPKLSNGGNIDYDPRWSEMEAYSPYEKRGEYLAEQEFEEEDLRENSRRFYESAEESVRKNLENGEICMCKLRKILGREPDYPRQVVGSLVLTKSFLRSFYKL